MHGQKAFDFLMAIQDRFDTVQDVGAGNGSIAERFRGAGKKVTTIGLGEGYDMEVDMDISYQQFIFTRINSSFDLIWCSHALEHALNVGTWLDNIVTACKPHGLIAITVPPAKSYIVGGHVSLWNAGLLLYRMVLAGMDCSGAHVMQGGYDISVVVEYRPITLPTLKHDSGDIKRLARWFPGNVSEGFDGRMR